MLIAVNGGDRSSIPGRQVERGRFILAFGAYYNYVLMVWADHLEDALDECVDWIADHAPGLLADDHVASEYKRLVAEGATEEDAQEQATVDTTCAGNAGHYLNSWEWSIVAENPSRETVLAIATEHRDTWVDTRYLIRQREEQAERERRASEGLAGLCR